MARTTTTTSPQLPAHTATRWLALLLMLCQPALSQSPVVVTNTPSVTVENTPGVVLMHVPGVTVENDPDSPVAVSVEDTVDNEPQSLLEHRVIGYTTTRSTGYIEADSAFGPMLGFAAMHELCTQQVPGATRAAFSHEALRPAAPLFGQVEVAWVIPSPETYEYSNAGAIDRVSCEWYAAAPRAADEEASFATGLAFSPFSGRIQTVSCEVALPVACSAPVAVPVMPRPGP